MESQFFSKHAAFTMRLRKRRCVTDIVLDKRVKALNAAPAGGGVGSENRSPDRKIRFRHLSPPEAVNKDVEDEEEEDLTCSLSQETIRSEPNETPVLPTELMVMIAGYMGHASGAHSLSLTSRAWNEACRAAFPPGTSQRFAMHAIYERPDRLHEVERITDADTMRALCSMVTVPRELQRLAKPASIEEYVVCMRVAARNRNREALNVLLVYGRGDLPEGGWALEGIISVVSMFSSSTLGGGGGDENAVMALYETVAASSAHIAPEVVRVTCFRRFETGIKCILRLGKESVFSGTESVRAMLIMTSVSGEDLFLSVMKTYHDQVYQIMTSGDTGTGIMSSVVQAGWTRAADAIIAIVRLKGCNASLLLQYAVITGKSELVSEIVYPRRRSERKRPRTALSQSLDNAIPEITEELVCTAIIRGYEDIATVLCDVARHLVTFQVIYTAIRTGHRAEFVLHLIAHWRLVDQTTHANAFAKAAIRFKNYEVAAMFVMDFPHLHYERETLVSILSLLGPFSVYAPVVSCLLHSPQYRDLFIK